MTAFVSLFRGINVGGQQIRMDNLKAMHESLGFRDVVPYNGIGRSKLSHSFIEKKLKTFGTARNWNTILQLQKLLQIEK